MDLPIGTVITDTVTVNPPRAAASTPMLCQQWRLKRGLLIPLPRCLDVRAKVLNSSEDVHRHSYHQPGYGASVGPLLRECAGKSRCGPKSFGAGGIPAGPHKTCRAVRRE